MLEALLEAIVKGLKHKHKHLTCKKKSLFFPYYLLEDEPSYSEDSQPIVTSTGSQKQVSVFMIVMIIIIITCVVSESSHKAL